MALGTILSFLNGRAAGTSRREPMFNSVISTLNNRTSSTVADHRIKSVLMRMYEKENGILTGMVNMVAKDVIEDIYFEPLNPGDSGRNKILRAREFYDKNDMHGMDFGLTVDALMTGEAYAYVSTLRSEQVLKEVDRHLQVKGLVPNLNTRRLFLKANGIDEEDKVARDIRYVASSTVENVYDAYRIVKYIQRVGMNQEEYSPKEIIHLKYFDVNGRPNGFTPVKSIILPLQLDFFMWRNMRAIAENSGQPDRVYSVEDIDINSPAFKRIERELKKYHGIDNRHGSLLLNGKVKIDDLQQLDQMQFKEMGFYIASILALQWSVPRSRLPFIVGGTNTSEDTGGNSEKNYYDNISFLQKRHESVFNSQFWIPKFGVRMLFKRKYLQDELRETQTQQMRLNNLTFMNNELAKLGKSLSEEYMVRYFNGINEEVNEEDIIEKPMDMLMLDNGMMRQGLENNKNLESNSDKDNVRKAKREEQASVAESRGKPTGAGKEVDASVVEIKEFLTFDIEGKEIKRVPYLTFVRLYNEDKASTETPLRVFMADSGDMYRFTYRSTDFVYEAIAPKNEVSPASMMNFRKVYRIDEREMLEIIDDNGEESEE